MTTKKFCLYAFALFGAAIMLFSSCEKEEEKNAPLLTTIEVTDITQTTATTGGNITDDGGATVIARGVCWSTSQNPTISDSKTEDGTGVGSFVSSISGLVPNTTYFVRAYATNSAGTGYGSAISLTTLEVIDLPTLTTTEVTEITHTTAISGGNITDDGGATVTARGVCWSKSQNPTISDSKTEDGTGAGSFTSSISGLEPNTTYYVRAYATNSESTGYGSAMLFTTLEEVTGDVDGNVYSTVVIGNQEWFAENLKTTKYRNGDPIPTGLDNTQWSRATDGAYAIYPHANLDGLNTDAEVLEAYGALYNWFAVDDARGLCPTGWRVPSNAEWTALIQHIDPSADPNSRPESAIAGGKLKSTRTAPDAHPRWESPNTGATDEYGFSALPGGTRWSNGDFLNAGSRGGWWGSTGGAAAGAWLRGVSYDAGSVSQYYDNRRRGFSVRCVRDN